ncbi:MAG TPA: TetR/AcrR family transcriptional regulator [Jatrophihabitantaceae bacterium]|nr:TetR/AcrR family transcriptional regulator [Jatrophihabitantaceae bacterium]
MTALIARQRKRGAELEDAIHDAVFAELSDVGYAGFTVEAVAARAKTGKASIYRRWGTKQDLVVDAFLARFGGPDEIFDELRSDSSATTRGLLVRLATRICEVSDAAGEVMRAVACEATRDPDLASAVDQKVHGPKRAAFVELLRRGVERGEVRPDAACALYADILPAMLTYRMVLNNQPVTERDAVEIVDHVVLPLIAPAS